MDDLWTTQVEPITDSTQSSTQLMNTLTTRSPYANITTAQELLARLAEHHVLSVEWLVEHTAIHDQVIAGSIDVEVDTNPGISEEIDHDNDLAAWLYTLAGELVPDDTGGAFVLDVRTRTVTWTAGLQADWIDGGWFREEWAECPTYHIA